MKTLAEVLKFLEMTNDAPHDINISGLALDSRKVEKGNLFLACIGHQQDGSAYIIDAERHGAAAVLYDAALTPATVSIPQYPVENLSVKLSQIADYFYDHPSQKLMVLGVTGTNGKTSTSQYLAQALGFLGKPCGIIGTVGNGTWGNLTETSLTTPDAISLQKLMHGFHLQKLSAVAMEVSSHGLAQHRVEGISFTLAIITNVTHDHLDYHETMENYAQAKARIFSFPDLKYAILNADDAYFPMMKKAIQNNTQCFTYGIHEAADVKVIKLTAKENGFEMQFSSPWGESVCTVPLLGEFNISNVLAVIASLGALGYSLHEIIKTISLLKGARGRMEPLIYPNWPKVIIDYAHTPDALEKALKAVRSHCPGKLWVITGCGGNRDRTKRPIMAAIAERLADNVILTEDNNRFEAFESILVDMMNGIQRKDQIIILPKRSEAIVYALKHAKIDDCILLLNKGHENYLDIQGTKHPFDERQVVASVCGNR